MLSLEIPHQIFSLDIMSNPTELCNHNNEHKIARSPS